VLASVEMAGSGAQDAPLTMRASLAFRCWKKGDCSTLDAMLVVELVSGGVAGDWRWSS
jgi:hypothetical protein